MKKLIPFFLGTIFLCSSMQVAYGGTMYTISPRGGSIVNEARVEFSWDEYRYTGYDADGWPNDEGPCDVYIFEVATDLETGASGYFLQENVVISREQSATGTPAVLYKSEYYWHVKCKFRDGGSPSPWSYISSFTSTAEKQERPTQRKPNNLFQRPINLRQPPRTRPVVQIIKTY
ncbi:hypothetical protein LCGC14_1898660, partial [marine sediment metagenome]